MVVFFSGPVYGEVQVPVLRMKFGKYINDVKAGNIVDHQELGALVTIQPTILWDLPSFKSRIGIHFIGDISSNYGFFPFSGMGFSGYFYPFGISSANEVTVDQVVQQKYKFGPYVYGGLSPLNMNVNVEDEDNPSANESFSALIFETILGAGVDYPLRPNIILSIELAYRFGAATDKQSIDGDVEYRAFGLMLGYTTSYF